MTEKDNNLEFKISTGLKNILGKELITNDIIAMFELVKNSYDAGSTKVSIVFDNIDDSEKATITIIDDGSGMSLEDIKNKWLFIAYSEKKNNPEITDYRNKITRRVAGAKGVGRFSCDRLGSKLTLISKKEDNPKTYKLEFDWSKYEGDDSREFESILIPYEESSDWNFDKNHGTCLLIKNLRESWDRTTIIELKRSLMKLVNPSYGGGASPFVIEIICPTEMSNDRKTREDRNKVNGIIINDVIEKLNIRTTSLCVKIAEDGKTISTTLVDRGEMIFIIKEEKKGYDELHDIEFSIFYLNRSAKVGFTKAMGIQPVRYGSIFIYKNGFRIYPYGEPGADVFNIDKRKAQGYNRYLGTRDLMGRIEIHGGNSGFIETTSRDGGFIGTEAVKQLQKFLIHKVLKVLEKYVVETIDWGDPPPEEFIQGKEQGLLPKDIIGKILENFVKVSKDSNIIDVQYGETIGEYIAASREQNVKNMISRLERIAIQDSNETAVRLVSKIRHETTKLEKQRNEAERETVKVKDDLDIAKKSIKVKEKQIFFLTSSTTKDLEVLSSGYHSIIRAADTIKRNSKSLYGLLKKIEKNLGDREKDLFSEIDLGMRKIQKIASYSLNGNFSQTSDIIKADVVEFVRQYLKTVKKVDPKLKINIIDDGTGYTCLFGTTAIGMIIDNVLNNSKKANATEFIIRFADLNKFIVISFKDNGRGLDESIQNIDDIFTFGFSTTKNGYGLGLYHIKKLVDELGGFVQVNQEHTHGFELLVGLKK